MKTLETERLILRNWLESDADDVFAYAKSQTVGPMAGWKPHDDLAVSKKILDMFMEEDETWAIFHKGDQKIIGSVGLHRDQKRNLGKTKVRELGYVLSEEYWGQGIIPEACNEILRFGFEELNLALISVNHYPFNAQSKRVIEKLGFHYEGTLRQSCKIYDETIYDSLCYSITREEYFSQSIPTVYQKEGHKR